MNFYKLAFLCLSFLSIPRLYAASDNTTYLERTIKIEKQFINLPVTTWHKRRLMRMYIDDDLTREFEIEYAQTDPQFHVFMNVSDFKGKTVKFVLQTDDKLPPQALDKITQTSKPVEYKKIYKEKLRPQIHFSSKRGWNNDSNGLVYYKGRYHLFYQHNPYGFGWGNMTWGHATSKDMIHWTEHSDAIEPDELGTVFSGSAVIDKNNTAGFKDGPEDPIICFYTSAGGTNKWSKDAGAKFTQSIAYSNDRGKTFTKYASNPVIQHIKGGNRDPKVFWHAPDSNWVMALYLDDNEMAILTSKDLTAWTEQSRLKDSFHECPEMFELPVDGSDNNKKWVFYGASGDYYIGSFDGKKFTPETDKLKFHHGNCFYASQTFNNMPDDRRVQIAWGRIETKGMPFNQMMLFPVELSLHTTGEGIRMYPAPIEEIKKLYGKKQIVKNKTIKTGYNPLSGLDGDSFDITAEVKVQNSDFGFNIRGLYIRYDVIKNELISGKQHAKVKPIDGKLKIRLIIDRTSVEVFVNDGQIYMPLKAIPQNDFYKTIEFFTADKVRMIQLKAYQLNSIWH